MASYDSDSSDGEDGEFTKTTTLLGYASEDPTDDTISQLGGYPTWLDNNTSPSGVLGKCKICRDYLTLLLQLNGDNLQRFPGHERRLYLFACRRKTCRRKEGSIRGIRGNRVTKSQFQPAIQSPTVAEPKPIPQANIGAQLFGASTFGTSSAGQYSATGPTNPFSGAGTNNPFSSGSNPFATASSLAAQPAQTPTADVVGLPETFASKARISDTNPPSEPSFRCPSQKDELPYEPWPPHAALPKPYPSSHLDAAYEELDIPTTPQTPQIGPGVQDTDMEGSGGGGVEKLFESSMDKQFQKFADRMGQNPEQILRYELGGQPLLYSNADAVGKLLDPKEVGGKVSTSNGGATKIPRCNNCGAERIFEVQLTPHAITVLEEEELSLEGMEWGTIILGVCGKDCSRRGLEEGAIGYVEEWVGVQWEEEVSKKGR